MTDPDLSKLPTGTRGWSELVAHAISSDDRLERFFLELKSDVDLSTKHGRHKVAKFILGAAHRDPQRAARRLGGHAVLLLGVKPGEAVGIGAFEAKDLEREIQKFTGIDPPGWDFHRITAENGREVIAVVVDPPTGEVWPCLADGEDLKNGDIYLRADGDTRKATGAEVRAILERRALSSTLPDVGVELVGEVSAVQVDNKTLADWIEAQDKRYRDQLKSVNPGRSSILDTFNTDNRSSSEFLREVEEWRARALAEPTTGLHEMAVATCAAIRVRVENRTRTFLREVRIDIELDAGVALEGSEPDGERVRLFTDRPADYPTNNFALLTSGLVSPGIQPSSTNGWLLIDSDQPPRLSLTLDPLRPRQTFTSDDYEVVIVVFHEGEAPSSVTGRWRLTAAGYDDLSEGDLAVALSSRDWRGPIASVLN